MRGRGAFRRSALYLYANIYQNNGKTRESPKQVLKSRSEYRKHGRKRKGQGDLSVKRRSRNRKNRKEIRKRQNGKPENHEQENNDESKK